jgi:hypothetical protein
VEGLSLGARARFDLGRLESDVEARFGTADRDLAGEFGITRRGRNTQARIAGYHRLDVADITTGPFSFAGTLNALLLGSDDDNYFRTTGAELELQPATTRTQWYELRLFAEQQRSVEKNTDFSIAHALDDEHIFRDNRAADRATQYGAQLRLRASHGIDPARPAVAGELELLGETGDYNLLRPRLRVRADVPVQRQLTVGGEVEVGTTFGEPTSQRIWQLGGARTIRGYSAGTLLGDTFWRARFEVGRGWPIGRLALFGDAAWAGAQDDIARGKPNRSAGIGISMFDGIVRLDVARGLDRPTGWKLHLHMNSIL